MNLPYPRYLQTNLSHMQDGVKDELAETVADEVNPDKTCKLMAVAAAARKLLHALFFVFLR